MWPCGQRHCYVRMCQGLTVGVLLAEATYWEIERLYFAMRLFIEVKQLFSHFPQAAEYNAGLCIDWLTCMAPKNRMVCFFFLFFQLS